MGAAGDEPSCKELGQRLEISDGSMREFLEPFLGYVMEA
jgi:hypothetical protein